MIDKKQFKVIDKYVLNDQFRYRVAIEGTNVILNVSADSDEEAIKNAIELAEKIGLTNEKIEELRKLMKSRGK
ncbi:MAG: hypothetical protein QXO78_01550 [Desulfurococcaceae archaeon]|uniref:Uncharacterized protein n=1 Tax=Staphylothermus marinus TaxID=2280 RepID=A0A7C4JLA0_STAMA